MGTRWVTALDLRGYLFRGWIGRCDDGLHAATDGKVADHRHASGHTRGDEVVEDLIGHGLEEDAAVAKFKHVVLQRFQLDAAVAGHIRNADFAEVGKPGFRADRGELGTVDRDLEVALGTRIWKRLQLSRA